MTNDNLPMKHKKHLKLSRSICQSNIIKDISYQICDVFSCLSVKSKHSFSNVI